MPEQTCPAADLLVRRLHALGARAVFGYPGGQLTPVYDALHRLGLLRHYLARHEQAAAFMADGYARSSGRPGVCLAVCGPGVFNAFTPLHTAHTDSVPLLLISGQVPRRGRGPRSGYYHENDQLAAAQSLTKGRFRVESPEELVGQLDEAWRLLTQGRPGPVLFEVPVDVLRAETAAALPPLPAAPPRPTANADDVDRLARLITGWRRPLLLAGGGVVSAGAEAELASLAERLRAPVFHTGNGKCALPSSHPLAAGLPWRRATADLSNMAEAFSPLFRQADGLLAVGCRFTQLATGSWLLPVPPSLGQIDIDAEELGRHYPVAVGVVGDARDVLAALLRRLPAAPRLPWVEVPSAGEPWALPGIDAAAPLRRALPADGIVAADVTRLAYVLMARFALEAPRTFLHPAGSVAMGYALPAALGAKAAWPDRRVVAVVGDGGLMMSALELATAVQEGLPVVVLLVNDNCMSLIKSTQDTRYGGRNIAVALRNPDFAGLARAFGVDYRRADDEATLEAALTAAFAAETPALVEVRLPG